MRKRGNVLANLASKNLRNSCQDVLDFGSAIEQMNVVPFSGIRISLNQLNHCEACATGELAPIRTEILGRLSWRHFEVELNKACRLPENCPAVLLVKSVLQNFDRILQELTLQLPVKRHQDKILKDCRFPRLRILKLREPLTSHEDSLKYLRALLSSAPNLQELHSRLTLNLLQNVLKGSSVVVHYVSESYVQAPFEEISEDFIPNLRLTKLFLRYVWPQFDFERYNRMIPMVMETCSTATLCDMWIDAIFLVPLMFYGICMRNVRALTISLGYQELELFQPQVLRILKNFDFKRIFPNLKDAFVLTYGTDELPLDHMNTIIEQANAVGQESFQDGAENIKMLFIKNTTLDPVPAHVVVPFLGEMFPNVEQLHIKGETGSETQFGSIWKCWLHLKQLDIGQYKEEDFVNLDSVFCGIFPEEVALLREMDDEYLQDVNIVPVMPSITCLKDLKVLQMDFPAFDLGLNTDHPSFIFSKVTRLTAFGRFPHLTVIIRIGQDLFILTAPNRLLELGDDAAADAPALAEKPPTNAEVDRTWVLTSPQVAMRFVTG